MRATMSILGLHNYTEGSIWEDLVLPAGVDRDVVIGNILLECAELELIYPDPDVMTTAIGLWAAAELDSWRKLYETTQFDYNPIWNKDGKVVETETSHNVRSDSESENGSTQSDGSVSSLRRDEGSQTQSVSAFDSTAFNNREKNDETNIANDRSETEASTTTDRSVSREGVDSHDRRYERVEQGNIGVTTTQQMIKEEREVDQFHIDDYIVQSFKRRFCLLVY